MNRKDPSVHQLLVAGGSERFSFLAEMKVDSSGTTANHLLIAVGRQKVGNHHSPRSPPLGPPRTSRSQGRAGRCGTHGQRRRARSRRRGRPTSADQRGWPRCLPLCAFPSTPTTPSTGSNRATGASSIGLGKGSMRQWQGRTHEAGQGRAAAKAQLPAKAHPVGLQGIVLQNQVLHTDLRPVVAPKGRLDPGLPLGRPSLMAQTQASSSTIPQAVMSWQQQKKPHNNRYCLGNDKSIAKR